MNKLLYDTARETIKYLKERLKVTEDKLLKSEERVNELEEFNQLMKVELQELSRVTDNALQWSDKSTSPHRVYY